MLALLGSDDREEILVYYMNWLDPRFAQNEALNPKGMYSASLEGVA
jgi:hypothetical protein